MSRNERVCVDSSVSSLAQQPVQQQEDEHDQQDEPAHVRAAACGLDEPVQPLERAAQEPAGAVEVVRLQRGGCGRGCGWRVCGRQQQGAPLPGGSSRGSSLGSSGSSLGQCLVEGRATARRLRAGCTPAGSSQRRPRDARGRRPQRSHSAAGPSEVTARLLTAPHAPAADPRPPTRPPAHTMPPSIRFCSLTSSWMLCVAPLSAATLRSSSATMRSLSSSSAERMAEAAAVGARGTRAGGRAGA